MTRAGGKTASDTTRTRFEADCPLPCGGPRLGSRRPGGKLVDYYLLKRGQYDVAAFFRHDGGVYGRVSWIVGLVVTSPAYYWLAKRV